MTHKLRNGRWLLGLAVAVVLPGILAADASARLPSRRAGKNPAKSAANHQLVMELHHTHNVLAGAKHDYDGHRAKAMHEITQAIHALHSNGTGKGGKGGQGGGNKAAGGTGGKGTGKAGAGENQQQSDVLLKQARQQLHVIHGQMGATHHAKAKGLVHAAIQQIDTALKIR